MSARRCAACGHRASDHPDGYMGASIWSPTNGEMLLCHTDDHSCYAPSPDHLTPPSSAFPNTPDDGALNP